MQTVKITFILLLIIPLSLSSCKNTDNESLVNIVRQEIDRYPAQRLVDIYKTFFQGYFGPAHLITDANSAIEYTKQEIAESNDFEDYDYCSLPPDGKFVRVNLKLVSDGKVSLENFTNAFVKSARSVSKSDIEKWKKIWPKILAEIKKQKPDMPKFQQDKAFIDSLLEKNEYVVHHSNEFIAKYHPHYRVMSAEQVKYLRPKALN